MPKPDSQAAAGYKEPDFQAIVAKPKSAMIEHFEEWVLEKTGYDPAAAKTKALAFSEGIRLGTALRGYHQASPENQERLAEAKAAREAAAAEEPEEKPAKPAKATKAAPAKATKAAPAAEPAKAVPPAKRAPAKKAPAKRAAAAAPVDTDEAPF